MNTLYKYVINPLSHLFYKFYGFPFLMVVLGIFFLTSVELENKRLVYLKLHY